MPANIPTRQPFRESDLRKLESIYKRAGRNIMATYSGATDFEQWRRQQIIAQIDQILQDTGVETGKWLDEVLPDTYRRGTSDVLAQLGAIRAPITANNVFSAIDKRSVDVLVSETQEAFAAALTTVKNDTGKMINQVIKDQISLELAEGRITGATRAQVAKKIIAQFNASGIGALYDKRGAKWELERYASMLAKTKMMEARNTGMANKMLENGYDLVEITGGNSTHAACAKWEYKVVSLTGKTKGYKTLADAKADGIFHPNCQHHYNIVHSELAAMTKAYNPNTGKYESPSIGRTQQAQQKIATANMKTAKANTAVVPKNSKLTLTNEKGQKFNVTLSPKEEQFVKDTNLIIKGVRSGLVRNGRTTQGYYIPKLHSLHVFTYNDESKHIFYHELGHALDHKLNSASQLIKTPDALAAMKSDGWAVVGERLRKGREEQKQVYSRDTFIELAKRGQATVTKPDGTEGVLYLAPKYRKYASSYSEIFADGYGQWRMHPAEFEKYAPAMAALYRRLM